MMTLLPDKLQAPQFNNTPNLTNKMFEPSDVATDAKSTQGKKEGKVYRNEAIVSKYFNVSNDVDTTLKEITFTADCQDALKKLQKRETTTAFSFISKLTSLKHFIIDSIDVEDENLEILWSYLSECEGLSKVSFNNIILRGFDKSVQNIVSSHSLTELSFKKCTISYDVGYIICTSCNTNCSKELSFFKCTFKAANSTQWELFAQYLTRCTNISRFKFFQCNFDESSESIIRAKFQLYHKSSCKDVLVIVPSIFKIINIHDNTEVTLDEK